MTSTTPTSTDERRPAVHGARRVQHDLSTGWTVRHVGGPVPASTAAPLHEVPATVPGSIHTDLLAADLIVDPYLDDHERQLQWIGRCDWEYATTFTVDRTSNERHELAFDGLDTVATVALNGTEVARTANQHRRHRFDVTDLLRDGENELTVRFSAPVPFADAQSMALGQRPQVNHHPFNAMRKMACNFGWDWGIDAATVGIWRPVRLESWTAARLGVVTAVGTADLAPDGSATGRLEVRAAVERAAGAPAEDVEVTVTLDGGRSATVTVPADASSAVVHLDVPDVALWWPRGYGEQPLHDVEVTLGDTTGTRDAWRTRTGFRSVRLDTTPDDDGTPFTILVNDRPIWVKGANWIPDDVFAHRVDRARYARRLDQAEQANMNLLRVWGGGIYEDDAFYELCDERGLLVWQDFAFACAAYSEAEPLRSEVEAEARDNVARLAPHPSLVLWNGSNENIWGVQAWGWEPLLADKSWGLGYYTDLLPTVVAEIDGTRPYTPSSPWSGVLPIDPTRDQNETDHGSMHSWEVWNRLDWTHYRDDVPRFMAEFGWQAPPTWATLTRAVSDDPLTPESPGMQVHQKAMEGNKKLSVGLVRHVAVPDDMDDWHWAMSWNQATAVRTAVEHLRSWAPRCTGSVVWQLNDCWPVTSWAAVDGDERPKPLLHALGHAHADRLVTIQPRPAGLAVVVVDDTDTPWVGDVVVRRLTYDGTELATGTVAVDVGPRGAATAVLPAEVATATDPGGELVVAELDGVRGLWFFAEPRDSALPAPAVRTAVVPADGGWRVRVQADTLVRDLTLLADKAHPDARVDDQMVTLLPGESVELTVRVPDGVTVDPEALAAPHVLRSLNQLVGGGR
ncbi:glycoside hydrolase family 2 protein [Isoptericola chiayiensis]|uniref:beta-mannosidase n=1 Tax=Isoptericola chiayiensis TaxID=579446 RepID=A0ABP8Y4R1_9MICO|nr:beta-mannosidase [Isoptericola chiayiensis]